MGIIKQQTSSLSDYYFCQPTKRYNLIGNFSDFSRFDYKHCPFYAPVVPDGICRLCHRKPNNHKKYFVYSNYSRKIQNCYLRYLLKKLYKSQIILFNKHRIDYNLFLLILYYKNMDYIRNLIVK